MKKTPPSIDGFVPRRQRSQVGELHDEKTTRRVSAVAVDRSLISSDSVGEPIGRERKGRAIGRDDISDSLKEIDQTEPQGKKHSSRRQRKLDRKERKASRKHRKLKRVIFWVIIGIIILAALTGGYVALKGAKATGNVFKGSILDLVKTEPLKQDANGRSNFLILGTSEDDPGHDAGYLTDSILVLSVDQTNKNAYMFSIPRDLYVNYGEACASGYRGKINVYFSCVNDGTTDADEQDRLTKTQAFIGNITGLDIQYGVHVNYTVMRDVVNAIGGSITVDIEGDNGGGQSADVGIMDSNFDWKCGATYAIKKKNCPPDGHFIQYDAGPQTIDAEHALYLAQARGDVAPTYGLAQSNFDRERNQQKILVAIKEKAMSNGTLTNLSSITKLIDALGSNLRTNIQTKEVRTLVGLGQDVKSENIKSVDLYDSAEPMFTTGNIEGAGSSVIPKAGTYDYSELQAYLTKKLSSNPVVSEGANVTVLNGSDTVGAAQTTADSLTKQGFTIDDIANAPDGTYAPIEIYEVSTDKTATAAKLKSIYNVDLKTTKPPISVTADTDFVIIVGNAASSSSSSSSN